MSSFVLQHLGRHVVSLAGSAGLAIVNLSDQPAAVHVNVKRGATWAPWSGAVTLEPGARWWTARERVPAEQVCVVVVTGQANGRDVVRVEY